MFLLLVTIKFDTLNYQPTAKAIASAFWFTVLAVASGIPCNAGVCLISEIFSSKKELVEGSSLSRAFFWILSSILSGTFLIITQHNSLFFAFAACFAASLLAFIILVFILPVEITDASFNCSQNEVSDSFLN
uniref:Major facilitator superfamily (MFS) profile domain-containing protein n=1 Tax=Ditylenchus dipsaci TaxID=166011 RepID=A0A915EQI1_9BILA